MIKIIMKKSNIIKRYDQDYNEEIQSNDKYQMININDFVQVRVCLLLIATRLINRV